MGCSIATNQKICSWMLHPCCCRGTSRGLAEFMRSKQSCPRAAGGETPLSSPERQATTAMPLRISRTPLQLGTIPSGNFHPHAHIPVHITIPISHPPTSPIPPTPCLFLLYHSPSSLVQSTYSSLPSPSSAWSPAVS